MNKSKLKKSLVIGSANFTQNYGVDSSNINHSEIKKIFNLAKKNKIYRFDSAKAYLKNNNVFKNKDKKFKFSTKLIFDHRWISLDYCQKQIQEHFKSFNKNKIETLFFHDVKCLLSKNGMKIFKNIELLKKKKYFQKIGFSIYDTKYLNYIMLNYNFDAVQYPYNILNKSILTSGWYDIFKNKGLEIHVRSIFLQGLLVNKLFYKKKYFKKWKKHFFYWFKNLENNNISPIDYCLSDLLNYDFDKIIIGVNNSKNLENIINFKDIRKYEKIVKLKISDKKLIDPRKWK